jgi:hypothetical protein
MGATSMNDATRRAFILEPRAQFQFSRELRDTERTRTTNHDAKKMLQLRRDVIDACELRGDTRISAFKRIGKVLDAHGVLEDLPHVGTREQQMIAWAFSGVTINAKTKRVHTRTRSRGTKKSDGTKFSAKY